MRKTNLSKAVIVVCVIVVSAGLVFAEDWPQWRGGNRDG